MSSVSNLRRTDRRDSRFREHDVVATSAEIAVEGVSIPAGARGVIVHIQESGAAYEVEFETPACVLTLRAEQLKAA